MIRSKLIRLFVGGACAAAIALPFSGARADKYQSNYDCSGLKKWDADRNYKKGDIGTTRKATSCGFATAE
jgi:hypothetical protein